MKKQFLTIAAEISLVAVVFGTPQQPTGISFTENKGQVHDQNYKSRPDVLYGAMTGNMAVHIKTSGVSYQLYSAGAYKETEDLKTRKERQEADRHTIYRIDLNWLNCNTQFTRTEDEAFPGYNNYYLENCPNGVSHVKTYKGVTLINLYKGINLHYYEKNGELKHDYIVAPHSDYKQIRLEVKGAEIRVNDDGSLLLITPLGKVQEGAPIVYQRGKQLKARWLLDVAGSKNNTLSFVIENYNPLYELIIDPITRAWGTYYGGSGKEFGMSCITDAAANVYMAGTADASTGTLIATSGSHQSTFGGGNLEDAFLVKFDGNGVRQWGTYYGGAKSEYGNSCSTDASGNVYLAGTTSSSVSAVIATTGSHQSALSSVFSDAFLVKFDGNGIRQWGTYYGGAENDHGISCSTDASGNVYLAGATSSSVGTAIATTGSHQSSFGGGVNSDAFLVKFNGNGVRQWSTYYGGANEDRATSCATDASGNVYLAGATRLSTGTSIATAAGHQSAYGGGTRDAFLVKFDGNGIRQWGTYYGGTGEDIGESCATDLSGNIYLAGYTNSNTGTVIATTGSHQSVIGGGFDVFLVKFNSSGARQWGTYYGGTLPEDIWSCTTDASGNVYLAGSSTSNTGTIIATAGSYQSTNAGGVEDGYLVKFNSGGTRQWGTYYGGMATDEIHSCTIDPFGNVYIAGTTTSGSAIATTGSHQSGFGGAYDAFLVKFEECSVAPAQPSAIKGPTAVCQGVVASYSVPSVPAVGSYTWSLPAGWLGSGNSNVLSVTAGSSGVFTLTAGNACGISPQQTFTLSVNPSPTVSVANGTICSGQSFTIVANGANTYTYSGGPVISPTLTSSYTVAGTSIQGCSNTTVSSVIVNPLPTVSVVNGTICSGQSFTILASGADTYTYSGGPVVSSTITSSYSVTGTSTAGCVSSNTAVSTLSVNPLPVIHVSTTRTVLCTGEKATLTASGGALSYTFTPGGTAATVIIMPALTSTYSVAGTDANGCMNTATVTQNVTTCTSVKNVETGTPAIFVFPNPTSGMIDLKLDADYEVIILNAVGQVVYSSGGVKGSQQVSLENLAKGIYIVKLSNSTNSKSIKIIKE